MNDLQPEALSLIFAYLPNLEDFVYCSLVCKVWAAAVLQARPKRLRMPNLCFDCPYDSAAELIGRLQVWQKRGGLQQLKHLLLQDIQENYGDEYQKGDPSFEFAEAVISLSMAWKLQTCELQGPFCLTSAVGKLPESIRTLHLSPHAGPSETHLSNLSRLSALRKLYLDISALDCEDCDSQEWEYCAQFKHVKEGTKPQGPDTCDVLMDGRLDQLRSLTLKFPFCAKANPDCDLASLLPRLHYLDTFIRGDKQGMLAAQQMIVLPNLQKLCLQVSTDAMWSWHLEVPASACLRKFCLKGPLCYNSPRLHVDILKPGIGFEGSRVHKVFLLQRHRRLCH
ncbi:hypothetical protein ABBQ38_015226 [Trebouxia sp. C0009 RCD-2024]